MTSKDADHIKTGNSCWFIYGKEHNRYYLNAKFLIFLLKIDSDAIALSLVVNSGVCIQILVDFGRETTTILVTFYSINKTKV